MLKWSFSTGDKELGVLCLEDSMRLNVCVGGCIKMYKFKSHLKVFNMSLEMKKKRLCKMHLILYGPNNGIFLLARSSWPRINYKCYTVKVFPQCQARFLLKDYCYMKHWCNLWGSLCIMVVMVKTKAGSLWWYAGGIDLWIPAISQLERVKQTVTRWNILHFIILK